MKEYVKKCHNTFLRGLLAVRLKFVQDVLFEARLHQRGDDLVWRATKALVELTSERETGEFITFEEIRKRSGIDRGQTPSTGLWPWLQHEAEVVQKMEGSRSYRISSDFVEAMQSLFNPLETPAAHSITELQGLGKDIWEGIDPEEYVEMERQSWRG
jgi:hypothetical protein